MNVSLYEICKNIAEGHFLEGHISEKILCDSMIESLTKIKDHDYESHHHKEDLILNIFFKLCKMIAINAFHIERFIKIQVT